MLASAVAWLVSAVVWLVSVSVDSQLGQASIEALKWEADFARGEL